MSLKHRIGLVFGIIIFITAFTIISRVEYNYSNQKISSLPTQGNARKEKKYYLKELNGYVAVYYEDKVSLYECTNIEIDELPLSVQAEINAGKEVIGITAVYGFLENYSSWLLERTKENEYIKHW